MKDVVNYVKQQKQLDKDIAAAILKEVKDNGQFIAISRKMVLTCSCGMKSEVWSNNQWLLGTVETVWQEQHMRCQNSQVSTRVS